MKFLNFLAILTMLVALTMAAPQCGRQRIGGRCPKGQCCSRFGYCGSGPAHCAPRNCYSQCKLTEPNVTPNAVADGSGGGINSIITPAIFDQMLKYRNDPRCTSNRFYTYNAFISAARSFNGFGTSGDLVTRKRELAAFLGQTSHETTGGWPSAPDGPYAWGYCFVTERGNPEAYCSPEKGLCSPGRKYYGRGPLQLTHNYNYAQAGRGIGVDLINNPDLVATDPIISFKTAIWFWMTPQANKPSSHDVIIGRWRPSAADRSAGRAPGYGVITNIINGGIECGHGPDNRMSDRIGFYKRYCDILELATVIIWTVIIKGILVKL